MVKDVRENRIRRVAASRGRTLTNSRRRHPLTIDFGDHSLIDARINTLVRGGDEHCDLDDVERYLDGRAS